MDNSEQLAAAYLRSLGFSDIAYEPDGNVPPDFLVNGRIAVEVRRLNQNVKSRTGDTEGIEEAFVPIWQAMYNYLPTLGPNAQSESWFVSIDVRRPLASWSKLKPLVRNALLQFMKSPNRQALSIQITQNLKLRLMPAGSPASSFFLLGGGIDLDAGGFVMAQVLQNLTIVIAEKEKKIAPYRYKYSEWWLVLSDHIGRGLDAEDRLQFKQLPTLAHSWDKIVLIDPSNPSRAFEV